MLISTRGWKSEVRKGPAGGSIQAQLTVEASSRVGRWKNISQGCVVASLPGFKFYQTCLIMWLWGWVTQEWVYETGQSLRRALSFPLSPSEIFLQTARSTGFHVIPLWTAKLTTLCIIETCITKRRMRSVSFSDFEWEMKEAGRQRRGREGEEWQLLPHIQRMIWVRRSSAGISSPSPATRRAHSLSSLRRAWDKLRGLSELSPLVYVEN